MSVFYVLFVHCKTWVCILKDNKAQLFNLTLHERNQLIRNPSLRSERITIDPTPTHHSGRWTAFQIEIATQSSSPSFVRQPDTDSTRRDYIKDCFYKSRIHGRPAIRPTTPIWSKYLKCFLVLDRSEIFEIFLVLARSNILKVFCFCSGPISFIVSVLNRLVPDQSVLIRGSLIIRVILTCGCIEIISDSVFPFNMEACIDTIDWEIKCKNSDGVKTKNN